MSQQMQSPNISIDTIKNSTVVECECGSKLFVEKMIIKKISPLVSPTGREEFMPIPLMVCEKCGKMPSILDSSNLIPKEFKTK
jgi:hypothetical protein